MRDMDETEKAQMDADWLLAGHVRRVRLELESCDDCSVSTHTREPCKWRPGTHELWQCRECGSRWILPGQEETATIELPPAPRWLVVINWILFAVLLFVLCAIARTATGEECPRALVDAIMQVETGSYLRDGQVVYRDRRDGAAGEVGPSQLSRIVCRQWGFDRRRLHSDMPYALACTLRHLGWLHDQLGTWDLAAAYNGGLDGRDRPAALDYAARVHEILYPR